MKLRRSERIAAMVQTLVDNPGQRFSLGEFAERFQAAKSTISEDLTLLKETFEELGTGYVETLAGAAGGVRYHPFLSHPRLVRWANELAELLRQPERILPGGFLYMTDLVFSPVWSYRVGQIFASRFRRAGAQYVVTVETKGVPPALMTARALGLPLVVFRRDSLVTEGPSVSINYVSGSSQRIQTMALPRRVLPPQSRVLIIDDFMKGGGTARGMVDLLAEVESEAVGAGVLVATREPEEKRLREYTSILLLDNVLEEERRSQVRPAPWLQ